MGSGRVPAASKEFVLRARGYIVRNLKARTAVQLAIVSVCLARTTPYEITAPSNNGHSGIATNGYGLTSDLKVRLPYVS